MQAHSFICDRSRGWDCRPRPFFRSRTAAVTLLQTFMVGPLMSLAAGTADRQSWDGLLQAEAYPSADKLTCIPYSYGRPATRS